jgi:hypothetical protein
MKSRRNASPKNVKNKEKLKEKIFAFLLKKNNYNN